MLKPELAYDAKDTKNEALGSQILKNLVFLALFGQNHPRVAKKHADKEDEDSGASGDEDDEEEPEEDKESSDTPKPLKWLVSRMSFIAKRGAALQVRPPSDNVSARS